MKQKVRLKGQLKFYMQWPFLMIIIMIAMNVWMYSVDRYAGFLMSGFIVVYAVIVGALYLYSRSIIFSDMVEFAAQYGVVQQSLLKELVTPYAILMEDGRILWMNESFQEILTKIGRKDAYISKYIPDINKGIFPREPGGVEELELTYDERDYRVQLGCVSIEGFTKTEQLLQLPEDKEYFITVSMQDVTELNACIRENEAQRLVAGLIYIDNYDEVMDSVEEVRQSLLTALIDRKINQYVLSRDGIVRKIEKDKYFIAIRKEHFKEMEEDKFSVLEEVKGINIGNSTPATLSIGLGLSKDAYATGYNYGRSAIDLALARGGDQAVIKSCDGITYYGGKREQTSKNTRVKARVKAEALREFMTVKDQILIMGHKMADADSLGAAMGIYRMAVTLGKKAHVVLNDVTTSLRPLYMDFSNSDAYPEDLFIGRSEAVERLNDMTMVVVVDTNKPSMVECEELLRKAKTLVVLDHHRQSSEAIGNTVLSYVEPYASSACEMVTELIQYIEEDVKLTNLEANALYAGIMIDTNNFLNRTGVRTFEAAAVLRRTGADITYVRKSFRNDMTSYQARAEIVSGAEVYENQFAIAEYTNENIESPTILGAQAANELLNIEGIKASFVLTRFKGRIYVSARAIDEVNVQIIMERLGGGGHINIAGTQFAHTNMNEAVKALKETIDKMIQEGDI